MQNVRDLSQKGISDECHELCAYVLGSSKSQKFNQYTFFFLSSFGRGAYMISVCFKNAFEHQRSLNLFKIDVIGVVVVSEFTCCSLLNFVLFSLLRTHSKCRLRSLLPL